MANETSKTSRWHRFMPFTGAEIADLSDAIGLSAAIIDNPSPSRARAAIEALGEDRRAEVRVRLQVAHQELEAMRSQVAQAAALVKYVDFWADGDAAIENRR